MTPRAALEIGEHGKITFLDLPSGDVEARTNMRIPSGKLVRVARQATSKAKAKTRLEGAVKSKGQSGSGAFNADMTVQRLGEKWWEEFTELDRAERTANRYREALEGYIYPELGSLKLRQATTGRLNTGLKRIAKNHGATSAKQAQTVLRGMFKLAVNHDAVPRNPMTDAEPVHVESRRPDALTVDQVREIRVQLPAGDVLDVFDMLLATGARIGEVLGILWTDIDLEAEHPTLHFTGKVYGSKRETFTKSKRDDPPMILPTFGIAVLERRERVSELVFPNTVGKPWDPNNFRKQWRAVMKSIGQDDLNTHKLRRTVATRIAQVMDSQTAADQLRHASSDVTERHYIAKLTENVDATQALETFVVDQSGR